MKLGWHPLPKPSTGGLFQPTEIFVRALDYFEKTKKHKTWIETNKMMNLPHVIELLEIK